ncbi:hypothetical protein [Draconibacterium sp.]|uniref:hypothetical protein n=1 Tax=Draconibacterium sp. TaxID=1965318 RepID=UPI00356A3B6C
MEYRDLNKDFHLKLSAEFKRIDQLFEQFHRHFIREQLLIANEYSDLNLPKDELNKALKQYAAHLFNCADSVADKDENYNEIRLALELESISRATDKYPLRFRESEFAQRTHQKAKELLIHFFPELMELSANGFRLLEKFSLFYNLDFISVLEENKTAID